MLQNKPRVSIGLPVFNGERYLSDTLDSILNQTFTDFELVIADNGSTDGTRQICEAYAAKDKRIKYHRSSTNLGIAPNYNRAFELSSGEYFKWADYDDLIAPDFISKCLDVLENHPDVSVCFPKGKVIDENGVVLEDYDPLPDTSSPEPHVRFGNLLLSNDNRVIQASGLMRANLVKKTVMHGSYPCSDEVFLAHIALLGAFYEIPERLFFVRLHSQQSTRGVLASERSRVVFFDTSLKDKIVLIKWLFFKDCLVAIRHSSISAYQKMRCYLHMVQWVLMRQNFRSMIKDMLLAVHQRIPLFPRLYQETLDAANKTHHYK
ncbi:MAG TPA: glycosyltransferase family A protein [Chloroflexota bacterium]|nr:glycosyltransferase family A protein [Chloroflexota bacterium]HUM67657.1 glycosyltransferase family A protein [Chloroflexota bacterium]